MKIIKQLLNWLSKPFVRYKRYRLFKKTQKRLEIKFQEQLTQRKALRHNINKFLREFFGIDAHSKYIPKNYKNSEEVRVAVLDKFGATMDNLNVKYEDLFK